MISQFISQHQFKKLFIEELGWDNQQAEIELSDELTCPVASVVAQKRGFAILVVELDRVHLADRALLRRLHKQLTKKYHENICIYHSSVPMKQVWQWSIKLPDGKKKRYREHPFFSDVVPDQLFQRIEQLVFSLDEEGSVTMMDALDRVRLVLDVDAELNLFAKKPFYAKQSDQLAIAMKDGDEQAFHEFVKFHRPLARKASRMLVRWFGMDPDDAEQTAVIGLIQAAQRFEPELGYQFSTFANYQLRSVCQRFGLNWGLPIRIPTHAFWPCYRFRFDYNELVATVGRNEAKLRLPEMLEKAEIRPEQWRGFMASYETMALTDSSRSEHLQVLRRSEVYTEPSRKAIRNEKHDLIREALEELLPRDAEVLRRRYGIDCPEQTLEEVGHDLGVTRERIRQIQVRGENQLMCLLLQFEFFPLPQHADETKTTIEEQEQANA